MSSTISPVTHSLGFEESVDKRPADALPGKYHLIENIYSKNPLI